MANNKVAFDPLKAQEQQKELRRAIDGMFSVSYMTLTSIVQGGIFAFLIAVIDRVLKDPQNHQAMTLSQWLIATCAFLTIIAVWHEYMITSTAFNWVPSFIDTLIPFLFGVGQICLILGIEQGIVWAGKSMTFLYIITFLAFVNMFWRGQCDSRNDYLLHRLGSYKYFVTALCLAAAIAIVVLSRFTKIFGPDSSTALILAFVMPLSVIVHFFRAYYYWRYVVQRVAGDTSFGSKEGDFCALVESTMLIESTTNYNDPT